MANDLATPEDEVFIHDGERPVTRSSVKTIHKNNIDQILFEIVYKQFHGLWKFIQYTVQRIEEEQQQDEQDYRVCVCTHPHTHSQVTVKSPCLWAASTIQI